MTQGFFAYSQKMDTPESVIEFSFFFFKIKVKTVVFIEGDYALSRSQNDKIFNI